MFVAIETKKRGWNLEFEEVDQVGPVHDRTYTYSLTIGAQNSDDVLVISVLTNQRPPLQLLTNRRSAAVLPRGRRRPREDVARRWSSR